MGNFANNAITDVGRMLLADVQAGAVFTPTRIVMGSGSLASGVTVQSITDVITPIKSLTINKVERTPDGKCIFGGVYTNENVAAPFYFRELALYAKAVYLNTDGSVKSEGAETLYSYGNAGSTADYMPAYSTSTVVEKQMDLVVWVGNDVAVNLTIESGVYASYAQLTNHITNFNNPHGVTAAQVGAATTNHNHTGTAISPVAIELNNGGQTGHGGYIDFHWNGATEPDTGTSRIIEMAAGVVALNGNQILTTGNLIALYGVEVTFTNGVATYSNDAITATTLCMVQRRSGAAYATSFCTHSTAGAVTINGPSTLSGTINLNILIANYV